MGNLDGIYFVYKYIGLFREVCFRLFLVYSIIIGLGGIERFYFFCMFSLLVSFFLRGKRG